MKILKNIDIYGVTYSVNSLGKETYKTYFGVVCTILTGILVTTAFFLFGRDFLYKKNPNVLQSQFLPDESEPIYVNSSNFTIAWRVEDVDENIISEEERYVWPKIQYVLYKKNEEKELDLIHDIKVNSKKCSETSAVNNRDFTSQNLETLQCVDLEELKVKMGSTTDVPLWGDWDENHISQVIFKFMNCKYDIEKDDYYDCLSFEEVERRNGLYDQYVSFYLPRYTFSPENVEEPLKIFYESLYYRLSPYSAYYEIYRYSNVSINDDLGWIFEDVRQLKAIEKLNVTQSFSFVSPSAYETPGAVKTYMLDLMFGRKQVKITRSYIKIQQLAANIGGIMKIINTMFMLLSRSIARWHMNVQLVNCFFENSVTKQKKISKRKIGSETSKNTIAPLKNSMNVNVPIETGLFSYFMNRVNCKSKKSNFFAAKEKIQEVIDVVEIYKMHLKVEHLVDTLLSEEAKKKMEKAMVQIVRDGVVYKKETEEEQIVVVPYKTGDKEAN